MATSTQNKPIFLVCGATGHQGYAVIKSLLKNGKFHIRGMTRDINSEKARKLRDQGVEMVGCDYTKCDELKNVLKGVDVFFGMTNYFDSATRERECQIGTSFVDCAKEMGIKHFIWSSLPNVEKLTGGKLKARFFTEKAKVGEYALKTIPTTVVWPGAFFQNFTESFYPHHKENDGTLIYSLPRVSNMDGIDINELGDAVLNIALNRNEWIGKTIPLASEHMPLQKYFEQLREVGGHKVKWNEISIEEFSKLNIKDAKELAEMFEWMEKYGCFGSNPDFSAQKRLGCPLKTFREFLEQTRINPK
jgi:uncharacterized protein YbjT (DUF2867 family)